MLSFLIYWWNRCYSCTWSNFDQCSSSTIYNAQNLYTMIWINNDMDKVLNILSPSNKVWKEFVYWGCCKFMVIISIQAVFISKHPLAVPTRELSSTCTGMAVSIYCCETYVLGYIMHIFPCVCIQFVLLVSWTCRSEHAVLYIDKTKFVNW